ncbi:hypothetical protein ES705_29544 [subsurface metagenome]
MHAAPGGQGDDAAICDYDPAKPSLWESEENKTRTADLWKTLAARYADEQWMGGYDLINETKWPALSNNNNRDLWDLMIRITDSIRTVDTNHLVITEGNWWANDYTGFPGPWDDNLVISFHKYWNTNNTGSIQWMLDMRNQYNVPLWLGETGENSNVWFTELIELMEEHNIGYAFWPEKKISSVVGPVTVIKTDEYQQLLDYWNNPQQYPVPSVEFAKGALMEMTENLKLENCRINRDVIDAYTRQVNNFNSVPFTELLLPGIIHATDFDMGRQGAAYYDEDYQRISDGGTWNNGWSYRNDGVDIEACNDTVNSNGFNVGWTAPGEWIRYTVDIDSMAAYKLTLRYAGQNELTQIHFELDSVDITGLIDIPSTGAWVNWDSLSVENIILPKGVHSLMLYTDHGGCNLSYFAFDDPELASGIEFKAVSAITDKTGYKIFLTLNKDVVLPMAAEVTDFAVVANGEHSNIEELALSPIADKIIEISLENKVSYDDAITLSYSGTSIENADLQILESFNLLFVKNNLPARHSIPGKIEAEDYYDQSGISTETTTDAGGGINIGYTDAGDYLDYLVDIQGSQSYQVSFRVASLNQQGSVELQLFDEENNKTTLGTYLMPVTGGWQVWQTINRSIVLPEGQYRLRVYIKAAGFNLNWLNFSIPSSLASLHLDSHVQLFPNPCNSQINLLLNPDEMHRSTVSILDLSGKMLAIHKIISESQGHHTFDVGDLSEGIYFMNIAGDKCTVVRKFLIIK